ncbi:hypothetical protein B0H13DRAFT_2472208 [Mycena leptocephala]|nr:hypothetical protein B0H13DRAFT_2472208 [Mycena leptocephala]
MPASNLVQQGKEKYTYKDHRVTNEHVNELLLAKLHLRVLRCTQQQVLSDLWTSHNQHGENVHQHGIAITDISARLLFIGTSSSCREIPQTVALSTTFVYTSPPLGPSPVAVSALPIATMMLLPVTTAPPAAPPAPLLAASAPAQAPPAVPNAPPCASAPGPLTPPAAPARAHAIPQVDPALQDIGIAYTAVAFASPVIVNWVVDSWDHAAHYHYAGIYAVHPNT